MDVYQAANMVVAESLAGKASLCHSECLLAASKIMHQSIRLHTMATVIMEHTRQCMVRKEDQVWMDELVKMLQKEGY